MGKSNRCGRLLLTGLSALLLLQACLIAGLPLQKVRAGSDPVSLVNPEGPERPDDRRKAEPQRPDAYDVSRGWTEGYREARGNGKIPDTDGYPEQESGVSAFAYYEMDGITAEQVKEDYKKFDALMNQMTAADREELTDPSAYGLTAGQMQQMEDLLAEITRGCAGTEEKIAAVYHWIAETIYYDDYMTDGRKRADQSPYAVVKSGLAVCDGYAQLFDLFLRMLGVPSLYVGGFSIKTGTETWETKPNYTQPENAGLHAWNMVYAENGWYYYDVTWDSGNWYTGGKRVKGSAARNYYKVSLDQISANHVPMAVNVPDQGHFSVNGTGYLFDGVYSMEKLLISGFPENVGTSYTAKGVLGGYPVIGFHYWTIQDSAGWDTIETLKFGKGTPEIAPFSCYGMKSLKKVVLPEGVETIGQAAFMDCRQLVSVMLSKGLREIGPDVFSYCRRLTQITIPDGVTTMGQYSFCGSGLQTALIPDSVTDGGRYSFYGCTSLKDLTMSARMKTVPVGFAQYCTVLKTATLPAAASYIGKEAFSNCVSLTELKVPNRVTTIYSNAFLKCYSLKKLTLGRKVQTISISALWGCTALKSLFCLSSTPPSVTKNFYLPQNTVVYVYRGKGTAYQTAFSKSAYVKKYRTKIVEK